MVGENEDYRYGAAEDTVKSPVAHIGLTSRIQPMRKGGLVVSNEKSADSEVMYHYCSLESFFAIVREKTIRLTSVFYMNDTQEHYWFRNLVARRIAERDKRKGDRAVARYYESLADRMLEAYLPEFFCACFSRDGDLLSQWRAYADDGRGVAIGFRRQYFTDIRVQFLDVHDVVYDEDTQIRKADEVISRLRPADEDDVAKEEKELCKALEDLRVYASSRGAEILIGLEAARFKNPAFAEEQEIRVVYNPNLSAGAETCSSMDFFLRNNLLVPFFSIDLEPSRQPFSEIIFGPKNDVELNWPPIALLLDERGFDAGSVKGRKSQATYR